MQVGGGECGGAGPGKRAQTYLLSLPHLSPLPVTVPTHSLNLEQPNLAPSLTFFVIFIFIIPLLPHYKSSPNPLYVFVRLTYSLLTDSQPLRSLPRGE